MTKLAPIIFAKGGVMAESVIEASDAKAHLII
jgi:hypothetical protein